jgi:hypothetical protein
MSVNASRLQVYADRPAIRFCTVILNARADAAKAVVDSVTRMESLMRADAPLKCARTTSHACHLGEQVAPARGDADRPIGDVTQRISLRKADPATKFGGPRTGRADERGADV